MLARGVGEVKGLAVRTRELRPRRAKAFTRLGIHHGFGPTETLPRLVGI